MKQTVKDLWNGNISPWSEKSEYFEETQHLLDLLDKNHNDLIERLDEKGQKILEKLENCCDEMAVFEQESAFIKGFTLGIRLMLETLGNIS